MSKDMWYYAILYNDKKVNFRLLTDARRFIQLREKEGISCTMFRCCKVYNKWNWTCIYSSDNKGV